MTVETGASAGARLSQHAGGTMSSQAGWVDGRSPGDLPSKKGPIMFTSSTRSLARGVSAAVLALGAIAAHAAPGFVVTPEQASSVKVGMSRDAVRAVLGQPARAEQFRNEAGPTWIYAVSSYDNGALLDVDFGADGRVVSTDQRIEPASGHSGS
jgi:SmpA / OmlA family